jgi:hypothetical protein
MQMTVNSDMEKRMDDNSSTEARHIREPFVNAIPSVETVIVWKPENQKKRQPI